MQNIKLHKESEEYIKNTLSEYKQVEKLPFQINGRTIIHLYATSDTMDSSGELQGFVDALLFTMRVYMCTTMTYWEVENRDGLELFVPAGIRIFKDGSTMIIIDSPITLDIFQCVTAKKGV